MRGPAPKRPSRSVLVIGIGVGIALVASGCDNRLSEPRSQTPHSPRERLAESRLGISHLLLITVDTLRADHLGMYGYSRDTSPNIDRWFADSRVYQRAYATEAATAPSVASILTGRLPQHHRVRLFYQLLGREIPALPDILAGAGYQTAAVVSNLVLTDEAMGMASRFDSYDDFVDEPEPSREVWERNARRTSDAAIGWLDDQRDPARPSFLWVHYMDPHGPYQAPEDRSTNFEHDRPLPFDPARSLPHQLSPGVDDALEYIDRYDEEIAYCDREIGRLLDHYQALGLAETALIVFTSDHGETMNEHEIWFTHQYHVYEGIVRVPLALRFPAGFPRAFSAGPPVRPMDQLEGARPLPPLQRGERIQHPVSLVDLLPTVLDALDVAIPAGLDGESLLSAPLPRAVFVEASNFRGTIQRRAMLRGHSKFVIALGTRQSGVRSRYRYDVVRDPAESERLAWDSELHDAEAAPLIRLIEEDPDPAGVPREYTRGHRLEHPKVRPGVDPEQLQKLRALGYVE